MKWKMHGLGLAAAMLAGSASAELVITEVMYDPAGGNEHEYIELYNRGASDVDLTGYILTDLANNTTTLPASSVPAGGSAVLIRIDGPRQFQNYVNAWGGDINWVPVTGWPILNNDGDTIFLADAANTPVLTLNYAPSEGFPTNNGFASITILDPDAANPYAPSNWALSVDGVAGARFGNSPRAGDVGSPGILPEPAGLGVLALGVAALSRRRRRTIK